MKRGMAVTVLATAVAGMAGTGAMGAAVKPGVHAVVVLKVLRTQIATARSSGVPVLLPRRVRPGYVPVHGEGSATADGYSFSIAAGRGYVCGQANACTLVIFDAVRAHRNVGRRVRLARGRTGYYTPMRCGASCADPSLSWNERGFTYTITGVLGPAGRFRTPLVVAANMAIAGGPR